MRFPDKLYLAELDPNERIENFAEVTRSVTLSQVQQEAARCLSCKSKPCSTNCPIHTKIPEIIRLIKNNSLKEATLLLLKDNPLPAITGRVCPQERYCEGNCVLAKNSISFGAIERFLGDKLLLESTISPEELKPKELSSKKISVAIIGSGPAGLSSAFFLTLNGAEVAVFEALDKVGGVLRYGIPEFRLPKMILDLQISFLEELGVQFFTSCRIEKEDLEKLVEEFDYIIMATGAGLPRLIDIPGINSPRVITANELLFRVNYMEAYKFPEKLTPVKRPASELRDKVHAVVVGAGNTAMDAARVLRRLGYKVIVAYRRSISESRARYAEITHAMEEGVKFKEYVVPVKVSSTNDPIHPLKITLAKTKVEGKKVITLEKTETLYASLMVLAIGSRRNFIEGTRDWIKDFSTKTTQSRIFAAGDIIRGAATVIEAVADGKRCAEQVLER